jgi:hypothetical protein
MFSYYLALLREVPSVFRGTTESVLFWIGSIGYWVVLYFAPGLRPMTESNPWIIGLPVAVGLAYGIMRVNYARFTKLQDDAEILKRQINDTKPKLFMREALIRKVEQSVGPMWVPNHPFSVVISLDVHPQGGSVSKARVRLLVTDADLSHVPMLKEETDSYTETKLVSVRLPLDVPTGVPPCLIGLEVRFIDPRTSQRYVQCWHWKWGGSESGTFSSLFVDASINETDRLRAYLKNQFGSWGSEN